MLPGSYPILVLQVPKPRWIVHASRGRNLTSMLDFRLLPMVPRVLLLLFFTSPLPFPRHRWPSSCRNSVTSLLTSHSHDSIHDCTQAQHNYCSNAMERSTLISSTNKSCIELKGRNTSTNVEGPQEIPRSLKPAWAPRRRSSLSPPLSNRNRAPINRLYRTRANQKHKAAGRSRSQPRISTRVSK